jgi:CDP-diacylglycerol--glycerol-3-phosphate 3-phosphatidyltransferase
MKNVPNFITFTRFPLLFVIVSLLYFPTRWGASLAVLVYALAAWTDWLDGFIARRWNIVSTLGTFMDALIDKIFTVGVFIAMLVLDIIPRASLFCVLLIISREFTITGLRAVAATKKVVIAAQGEGKIKTALQMISTVCLLLFFALKQDFRHLYTLEDIMWLFYTGYALFIAATIVTGASGVVYLVRFKHVFSDARATKESDQ